MNYVLADQKKLSEVGSLSAAAVHELSTPLNTIFLILDDFIKDTDTDPFEVSILDFEEHMYRETKHYLYTEEIDCDVMNILIANGGVA